LQNIKRFVRYLGSNLARNEKTTLAFCNYYICTSKHPIGNVRSATFKFS